MWIEPLCSAYKEPCWLLSISLCVRAPVAAAQQLLAAVTWSSRCNDATFQPERSDCPTWRFTSLTRYSWCQMFYSVAEQVIKLTGRQVFLLHKYMENILLYCNFHTVSKLWMYLVENQRHWPKMHPGPSATRSKQPVEGRGFSILFNLVRTTFKKTKLINK